MAMKCPKCGFENPSTMDYCGNCGCSFGGTEGKPLRTRTERAKTYVPGSASFEDRGRISSLLYLGSAMIALSGLLSAYVVASYHGGRSPSSFSDYSGAIMIVGVAFILVGFARQARRMCE